MSLLDIPHRCVPGGAEIDTLCNWHDSHHWKIVHGTVHRPGAGCACRFCEVVRSRGLAAAHEHYGGKA